MDINWAEFQIPTMSPFWENADWSFSINLPYNAPENYQKSTFCQFWPPRLSQSPSWPKMEFEIMIRPFISNQKKLKLVIFLGCNELSKVAGQGTRFGHLLNKVIFLPNKVGLKLKFYLQIYIHIYNKISISGPFEQFSFLAHLSFCTWRDTCAEKN